MAKLLTITLGLILLMVIGFILMPRVEFIKNVEFEKQANEKWIGVISDTHLPTRAKEIPAKVFEIFKKVDLIIHAGDFVELEVLRELEKIAPVIAVSGNMDSREIREELPLINSLEIYGKRIGVIHDAGIFGKEKMKKIAKENNFDILIFGHTHRQFLLKEENKIFINPGSPTQPLPPFLIKPSIALLRISEEKVEINFIEI